MLKETDFQYQFKGMYFPQAIQGVDSSWEQILKKKKKNHNINCSPMDFLQWMGAARKRVASQDLNW